MVTIYAFEKCRDCGADGEKPEICGGEGCRVREVSECAKSDQETIATMTVVRSTESA